MKAARALLIGAITLLASDAPSSRVCADPKVARFFADYTPIAENGNVLRQQMANLFTEEELDRLGLDKASVFEQCREGKVSLPTQEVSALPAYQNTLQVIGLAPSLAHMNIDPLAMLDEPGIPGGVQIFNPEDFGRFRGTTVGNLRKVYGSFLASLPEYSKFEIFVPDKEMEVFERFLSSINMDPDRVNLWRLDGKIDPWIQDWGEWMQIEGRWKFVLPMDISEVKTGTLALPANQRRYKERRETMQLRYAEKNTVLAPFMFDGGNLEFDEAPDGHLRAFLGYSEVKRTQEIYSDLGQSMTIDDVKKLIQDWFGQNVELLVVGEAEQTPPLIHHDQYFALLRSGEAAVLEVTVNSTAWGSTVDLSQLDVAKQQLSRWGYKTHPISETLEVNAQIRTKEAEPHLLDGLHSTVSTQNPVAVNGLPYIDARTGVSHMLFPVDVNDLVFESRKKLVLGRDDLLPQAQAIYDAYAKAGVTPVPHTSWISHEQGDTHCVSLAMPNALK